MHATAIPAVFAHLPVLADLTRSRILLLLDGQELTVAELCAVLQTPQSTVSRHLKALADGGWVTARAEGTSRRYRGRRDVIDPSGQRLWQLVREQVANTPSALQDGRRLERVLSARRSKSQQFFTTSAGRWDKLREELFGDSFHLAALLGLLDPDWTVGDLGCGTGQIAEALAPWVKRVIAVDESAAMLRAAKRRVRALAAVEVRRGALEALPIEDASLDAVTCVLVLHHVPAPERALAEAARVLRPGGRLLLTDMMPHDREAYRHQMGHVWLGFSEAEIQRYLADAGFTAGRIHVLSPDPSAQGPTLFAVAATRRSTFTRPAQRTATREIPTTHS
ncbi:MAG: metalloregulator ArsR/SmtB family transcription factor [Deltaproteobacteria bacterium]|nr:metalloregulator ArsR/SmtB family transcription factor [Deltaproteobacteria bacterium]